MCFEQRQPEKLNLRHTLRSEKRALPPNSRVMPFVTQYYVTIPKPKEIMSE